MRALVAAGLLLSVARAQTYSNHGAHFLLTFTPIKGMVEPAEVLLQHIRADATPLTYNTFLAWPAGCACTGSCGAVAGQAYCYVTSTTCNALYSPPYSPFCELAAAFIEEKGAEISDVCAPQLAYAWPLVTAWLVSGLCA